MEHNSVPEAQFYENLSLSDVGGNLWPGGNAGRERCRFHNHRVEENDENAVMLRVHGLLQGASEFASL